VACPHAADIDALRLAARLVEAHAPAAFEADVKEIIRRLGWILAGFPSSRICQRCDTVFEVDAVQATHYAVNRQPLPSVCRRCKTR
jgi:hypothetical protein